MSNYSYEQTKVAVRVRRKVRLVDYGYSYGREEQRQEKRNLGSAVGKAFVAGLALSVVLGTSGLTILASAFEAHVVNVTAKIEPPPCTAANFEQTASGQAILNGQLIDEEYAPWGLLISAVNNTSGHPDKAIIFDSANPSVEDVDIGTPNEDFGGPGKGAGGEAGTVGENSVSQRNLLILAENDEDDDGDGLVDLPDDEKFGGVITFLFSEETFVESLRFIDADDPDRGISEIFAFDKDGIGVFGTAIPILGDNSAQTLLIGTGNIKKLEVRFAGSGAIDDFCFGTTKPAEEENNPEQSGIEFEEDENGQENDPEQSEIIFENAVALNEILPNPEGLDTQEGLLGEWVELYNLSGEAVDVVDWYIEDASSSGNRQTVSSSTTHTGSTLIGANGSGDEWLVVFMAGAVLNNTGDTVSLYNAAGELQDEHIYSANANDEDSDQNNTPGAENEPAVDEDAANEGKSIARIPDGTGEWIDPVPTPGGPNQLADEEVASDEGSGEEQQESEEESIKEEKQEPAESPEDIQAGPPESSEADLGEEQKENEPEEDTDTEETEIEEEESGEESNEEDEAENDSEESEEAIIKEE